MKADKREKPAVTTIVWTLTDEVIEDPRILDEQFKDIKAAGFGGVTPFVRCSRYRWDDDLAQKALVRIRQLCEHNEMDFWTFPDPRFLSRDLTESGGWLDVVLFGETVKAEQVPHRVPIENDRYRIRCTLAPRHSHMVHEVAVEYQPVGLLKVYAVRRGKSIASDQDIRDITPQSHFFYNAREGYMEAFGTDSEATEGDWDVVAFFHCRTCHVDFSNPKHMKHYQQTLKRFAARLKRCDLIGWDEPGYTCLYGALPFSKTIRKRFKSATQTSLVDELWKLAIEAEDQSHQTIRIQYYRTVQKTVVSAQKRTWKNARSLWGDTCGSGIHDTWHFESADMADMNHGSMDAWRGLKSKSAGFVDLGGVIQLKDPQSDYYANLAALSVIDASLGRHSRDEVAYNNLWTVEDDDTGDQIRVMNHCVNVMALFGLRWLAHIYGPVGTIGEEEGFLGSPFMPGYPHHSTWPEFPRWTQRLRAQTEAVQDQLPQSNMALLFPVETLYTLSSESANQVAGQVFKTIQALVDHHYHVDVISPALFADGSWNNSHYYLGTQRYITVLCPYPRILKHSAYKQLRTQPDRILYLYDIPGLTPKGNPLTPVSSGVAESVDDMLSWLHGHPTLRPIQAPEGCWVSHTPDANGDWITLVPSRVGESCSGQVTFRDKSVPVECDGLVRIYYPRGGDPRVEYKES